MRMKSPDSNFLQNQSAAKVLTIIEYLADKGTPQRLQDISKDLLMNASTLVRFLSTLQCLGYAAQEPDTSRYYLTLKICSIANQVSSSLEIRDVVRPFLKNISATLKESSCFALEQDMSVVYVEVVQGPNQGLKLANRIGSRAPLHCTGIGKLFLSEQEESYIDTMISQKGMQRFTDHTILTRESLLKELEVIRQQGYAYDREECDLGVSCIAFPLRDYTKKIIAGLSVSGLTSHIRELDTPETLQYLKSMSSLISEKLGYAEKR